MSPVPLPRQPFCDGAHRTKAPDMAPLRFSPEKDGGALLCACKETRTPPYCDGSHLRVLLRDLLGAARRLFK
ncbi:unnamed protein product [Menidia menidia]|uniref:(Atlantic silverside) hypothetical protein n=1 Tax=Menidia menidia TaxID=238744 RepID=A0A8S4BDS9_9TELE|nr:unnamed protein product [Menidia menidia]